MRTAHLAFASALAIAQAQTISYVASIKPNNSAEARGVSEYYPGGRFSATAITVSSLLRTAYRIQNYQLVGAPAWFATKRYDIAAKADGNPPPQQLFLQTLLKDQFKLAVHKDTREMPAFALVLAKSDGRLGPQLIKSDFDCAAYMATTHALPEPGRISPCSARINAGALSGKSMPMAQLATSLAYFAGRFVIDKTGLAGGYDVELKWTPDQNTPVDDSGPSVFTALQEQLGLKLVSERAPVDVLVVDGAQEPVPE